MKTILLSLTVFWAAGLRAQYYYKDILTTQETNRQMKAYVGGKVKTITGTGYDERGTKSTDYIEVQEVKENGTLLKVSTINNFNKTVVYSRFDSQGRIISITDSSTAIGSATAFAYDAAGNVIRVQNTTTDPANDFNQVELHQWSYNAAGKPEKMLRTINNADSLEIRLVTDENGNPADERTYKKGIESSQYYYIFSEKKYVTTGAIYYYYDDRNRLTDIVRYNLKADRLLPDLMFEYDEGDRIIQKITTTTSVNLSYLTWRYIFNEKGLKTSETLFNKDKKITGKIRYAYTFGQ